MAESQDQHKPQYQSVTVLHGRARTTTRQSLFTELRLTTSVRLTQVVYQTKSHPGHGRLKRRACSAKQNPNPRTTAVVQKTSSHGCIVTVNALTTLRAFGYRRIKQAIMFPTANIIGCVNTFLSTFCSGDDVDGCCANLVDCVIGFIWPVLLTTSVATESGCNNESH